MPFAVALFLDEKSSATVTNIWHKLAERDISASRLLVGFRPHVTLVIADDIDREATGPLLDDFGQQQEPLDLVLSYLGVFPSETAGAIYLGVTVTQALLRLHNDFCRRFDDVSGTPRDYYLPGNWVPHCTLADGLSCETMPRGMEICREITFPMRCQAIEIGVLEFPPGRELLTVPLRYRKAEAGE